MAKTAAHLPQATATNAGGGRINSYIKKRYNIIVFVRNKITDKLLDLTRTKISPFKKKMKNLSNKLDLPFRAGRKIYGCPH